MTAKLPSSGPGRFVWHELLTPDPERALRFYRELLGWTVRPMDRGRLGTCRTVSASGVEQGGVLPLPPGQAPDPRWLAYVAVDSLESALVQALELGGEVRHPAEDLPGIGRAAVVTYAGGAELALAETPLTERPGPGAGLAPGTFCWDELLARAAPHAVAFFCGLLGWGLETVELPGVGPYTFFTTPGGGSAAGMLPRPPDAAGPSAWLPYLVAASVDTAAGRAEQLGGTAVMMPTAIPGVGRYAVIEDPQGAVFALLQPIEE